MSLPLVRGLTRLLANAVPDCNAIEHLWRHITHEELPLRHFSDALKVAVDGVLDAHVAHVVQIAPSDVLMRRC